MSDGLTELPNLHDHFVYGLAVHLEGRWLVLHTEYRNGPGPPVLIDLRFVGLIAHYFVDVAEPSILLDIENVGVDWIVEEWGELFDSRKNYGWPPIEYADRSDLAVRLTDRGVQGYRVMGSCGLDGFVLAAGVEYCRRERAWEPT